MRVLLWVARGAVVVVVSFKDTFASIDRGGAQSGCAGNTYVA